MASHFRPTFRTRRETHAEPATMLVETGLLWQPGSLQGFIHPIGTRAFHVTCSPAIFTLRWLVAVNTQPDRRHKKLPGILSTFHVPTHQANCPFTSPFWSRHQRERYPFVDNVYDATSNPQQTSNAGVHRKPRKRAAARGRRAELCLAADPCCRWPARNRTPRDGRSHGRATAVN